MKSKGGNWSLLGVKGLKYALSSLEGKERKRRKERIGSNKKKAFFLLSSSPPPPLPPYLSPHGFRRWSKSTWVCVFLSQLLALGEAEEDCDRAIEAAANRLSCATRLINILIKYVATERTECAARLVVVCFATFHNDTFCTGSFAHERSLLFSILWFRAMVFLGSLPKTLAAIAQESLLFWWYPTLRLYFLPGFGRTCRKRNTKFCRQRFLLRSRNPSNRLVNPFTPKFKKHILPTFKRRMYKWGSENW